MGMVVIYSLLNGDVGSWVGVEGCLPLDQRLRSSAILKTPGPDSASSVTLGDERGARFMRLETGKKV